MPLKAQSRSNENLTVRSFMELGESSLKLHLIAGEHSLHRVIKDPAINRPALAVTGYYKNFASRRIQLFGAGEMSYLRDMTEDRQREVLEGIVQKNVPCMVVSRNLLPTPVMEQVAEESRTPLFRTPLVSRDFSNHAILLLEEHFAPKTAEHGTLMDVKGIGTLIRGSSGVGKSECALALIERGHSLVADDLVYIRLINERLLSGKSSDLNRGFMECRGLGIIDIGNLFGIRSVRPEKTVNLVVTFEMWKQGMDEERTGLEQDYYEILGVKVPHIRLPVRPGRDLARLVEVAAMVQALKAMGHDSAKEFNDRLIAFMAGQSQ